MKGIIFETGLAGFVIGGSSEIVIVSASPMFDEANKLIGYSVGIQDTRVKSVNTEAEAKALVSKIVTHLAPEKADVLIL